MVQVKKKGNSWEREVAKILTEHTKVQWHRVPTSGAFGTISKTTDPRFLGDVYTDCIDYHDIVIECKSYKSLELNELLNSNSKFWDWITQSELESKGKDWLLLIKINRKGKYIVYYNKNKLIDKLNKIGATLVIGESYTLEKLLV